MDQQREGAMTGDNIIEKRYRAIFYISKQHKLVLVNHGSYHNSEEDNDDFQFEERNAYGHLIATYVAWHHLSLNPSFHSDSGYKKFTPDGYLIERG
jgi:hypothetical protein